MSERGKQGGDLPCLQEIDQTHEHRMHFMKVSHHEIRDRIDDDDLWVEFLDEFMNTQEMHFEPALRRAPCLESQDALLQVFVEIDADRTHIARGLHGRFFERNIERFPPVEARSFGKTGAEARFTGTGGTADQNRTAFVEAFA